MAATPALKTRIVSYFSGMLDVRTDGPKIRTRKNLKVRVEGEVITSDEFVDLLEEQKASKEAEKRQKATRILVGVGFTIGVLALTESQAHVKGSFAVIAKDK